MAQKSLCWQVAPKVFSAAPPFGDYKTIKKKRILMSQIYIKKNILKLKLIDLEKKKLFILLFNTCHCKSHVF